MSQLNEQRAITAAEAQFAADYPHDALWPDRPRTWVEADRIVVALAFRPKGIPMHPSPHRYFEILSDAHCRELHGKDSQPYWPQGPRK